MLREMEGGHTVACHFAEEVAGSVEQALVTGQRAPVTATAAGADASGEVIVPEDATTAPAAVVEFGADVAPESTATAE